MYKNNQLTEFIKDNNVIKERIKILKIKMKLKKHYVKELILFNKNFDDCSLETYVRIKYLLGEPL